MALIVLAGPALAQSIDLSPVQTLLQGIVDAITGPLGIVIGTLALIGVLGSSMARSAASKACDANGTPRCAMWWPPATSTPPCGSASRTSST
ncbi:TrbC/VirB2 family protein [Tabrizicola fusiformis]|uniref:TrbC/VirB2 family protein n=1 Tax=Tabrizicola sp. SY72 TaxID=2741673 RepID=UPI001F50E6DF|nr:TrbC/VirB2 family protein [Tabrizicola sp. SY72]